MTTRMSRSRASLAAHVLLDGLILRAPGRDSEGRTWARERHPLFLSMLPLHADHPRKLAGYALVAAEILSELETPA